MWLVYMIYPEVNSAETQVKGSVLRARGLIRISEMQVGRAQTQKEARKLCVKLAVQALKDRGEKTTVIGFGIRNFYDPKKGLSWKMTIAQVIRILHRKYAAQKAA